MIKKDKMDNEIIGYIYCINNKVTNMKYIGQTTKTIENRFKRHIQHIKHKQHYPLYFDMLNYGLMNFEVNELEKIICNTKDELCKKIDQQEIYWINEYDVFNNGYNQTSGGNGALNRICSDITKLKISEKNKGENNGMYGTTWSEEKTIQMRELMTGENNPQYGKPKSDETKEKLSKALTGRVISEETKEKISNTMKGVKKSDEMKAKLSESKKGVKLSDETKEKIKNTRLKGKDNPKSKKVGQYSLDDELIKVFDSMSDAARECNTYHSSISACCSGKKQTSGGYKWKYHIPEDLSVVAN